MGQTIKDCQWVYQSTMSEALYQHVYCYKKKKSRDSCRFVHNYFYKVIGCTVMRYETVFKSKFVLRVEEEETICLLFVTLRFRVIITGTAEEKDIFSSLGSFNTASTPHIHNHSDCYKRVYILKQN